MVGFFSLIPFPLLYLISDVLRVLFKNIAGYRVSVIKKNLAFCFPHKTEAERKKIFDKFYKNFIDIILESIKGLSIDPDKLKKRYSFKNPEVLDQHFNKGQHIITYSQHCNNWEWAPICLGIQMNHCLMGIVKMISNQRINKYMIDGRSGNNVRVISTKQTGEFFKTLHKEEDPLAIVFIADQMPYGKVKSLEVPFLGQQVKFHHGAALYAERVNLPIYTIDVARTGRGRYEVQVHCIKAESETLTAEEITYRYAGHLEEMILESPESWLWSHKRFKKILKY